MTPRGFRLAMAMICQDKRDHEVMLKAQRLIAGELGEGMPAYVPAFYLLFERLGRAPAEPEATPPAAKRKKARK
jgi:hypothetical protein